MRFYLPLLLAAALPVRAQEMKHDMAGMDMPGMNMSEHGMQHYASGTSFNPASSPMNMVHFKVGKWRLMLHGLATLVDTQQSGPRGHDKLFSTNWVMAEGEHLLGGGSFAVRSMLSFEPATITSRRFPELLQTGETAFGKPIIDGQHPHDFFMELSLRYTHPLGEGTKLLLYFAPVGDPALGPVGFPHRISAMELPQAPLAHHLQDSTHIANDVVTAGITRGIFGIEASGFHGREPNEFRWNIDHGAIDSYSARATVSPSRNWTAQFSAGRLRHPEDLEPGDQTRVTASTTYVLPYTDGEWATSLIWGRVHKTDSQANLNGYAIESVARFGAKNYLTTRLELVDKDELPVYARVGAYTAGYTRDFYFVPRIATGFGANVTQYSMPETLHALYGKYPVAVLLFMRLKLR